MSNNNSNPNPINNNDVPKKGQSMGSEKFGNKDNTVPPDSDQKNFIREEHVLQRGQPMGSAKFGHKSAKENEQSTDDSKNPDGMSKHTKTDKGNDLRTDPVKITEGEGGKFVKKEQGKRE